MHFIKKNISFPVYTLVWQDDFTIIAAGGGGIGNSGVKNKIIKIRVQEPDQDNNENTDTSVDIISEYLLSSQEDAPMTLAVTSKGTIATGINQSESVISETKHNRHLRLFESSIKPPKITFKLQKQVFQPSIPFDSEFYQRQTCFNRLIDPTLLALSSTAGQLSILSFPILEPIFSANTDADIIALDFSPAQNDTILYITPKTLNILPFRDSKRIRLKNKKQFQDLQIAASQSAQFSIETPLSYRCARFLTPTKILACLNDRASKSAYFHIFVLNLELGWRQTALKRLPTRIKAVTSMDVNQARRIVAISTTDMSINIFNMDSFATLLSISRVADFSITQVAFNPIGKYLACSSVANTVSLIDLDQALSSGRVWNLFQKYQIWIISILALVLGLMYLLYKSL